MQLYKPLTLQRLQSAVRLFIDESGYTAGGEAARKAELCFLKGHALTHELDPQIIPQVNRRRSILKL